jgi:hypothetical protein
MRAVVIGAGVGGLTASIGAAGRWQNPLGCWVRNKVQKRILPGVAFRDHCDWMDEEP